MPGEAEAAAPTAKEARRRIPGGEERGERVTEPVPLPAGFMVGHWSDPGALTGCSVVIPPPGSRGGVWVQGGGPGTRETDTLGPLARSEHASAVVLTGGSAFGLAAADGVVRWLEQHEIGHWTPAGLVPLVPAAVIYDLASGDPKVRPGPEEGYAACEAAGGGIPERGSVGVGCGATVANVLGRERASSGGFGFAALRTGAGETVAAVTAVNAAGDVLAEDGTILAGPRGDDGEMVRGADLIVEMEQMPELRIPEGNTTLVCICTDAPLDKRSCGMVARAATAGIARAVDPTFTPVDGDVAFCLASGEGEQRPFLAMQIGAAAATVTAAAIRDAIRQGAGQASTG
ncbi:MAG TPA: P1 family peptidase [Solirubrobacterales bacterium]|nr:P1 family peptidase [Solirubrobacterales bacterium]